MADPRDTRRALSIAALVFALAAPIAYVAQRLFERAWARIPDPLLVVKDAHVSFFWRVATATWWGGLLAGAAFVLLGRAPRSDRAARIIMFAAGPAAVALALLSWRYP